MIMLKLIKLWITFKQVTIVNIEKVMFLRVIVISSMRNQPLHTAVKLITIMIGLVEILRKRVRMIQWIMIILRR